MRSSPLLVVLLLLAPLAAANHAVYVDRTRVLDCLLWVQTGATVGVNCPGTSETVNASEPAGGQYRLTVDWVATSTQWAQLRASLVSCKDSCGPTGTGVCINNNCVGNPNPGQVVQSGEAVSASPLVLVIPTAGDENRVTLTIRPAASFMAAAPSQTIHYVLDHVG